MKSRIINEAFAHAMKLTETHFKQEMNNYLKAEAEKKFTKKLFKYLKKHNSELNFTWVGVPAPTFVDENTSEPYAVKSIRIHVSEGAPLKNKDIFKLYADFLNQSPNAKYFIYSAQYSNIMYMDYQGTLADGTIQVKGKPIVTYYLRYAKCRS